MVRVISTEKLLEELNLADECDTVEAKEISGSDAGNSLYETICAFCNEPNLGGGTILLGVKRDGTQLFPQYKVSGVKDPDKLSSDIVSACQSKFNSIIRPHIKTEIINKKSVLRIDIHEIGSSQKPLYILNFGLPRGAFRRINSSDVRCTSEDLAAFYQDGAPQNYDEQPIRDSRIEDIDPDAIKLYRRFITEFRPSSEVLSLNDRDLLVSTTSLKLKEESARATATGLVVFGKTIALRRFLPQIRADYVRVPGKEWISDPSNRLSSTDMRGPLISLIDRIIAAISDDLPKRFQFDNARSRRTEVPVIPHKAIREAVVNAVLHRNYKVARPIQVIRYSNRLVLENPGHSLKAQEQFDNPGSVARNPHIAAILHETHFAETKGTGFRVMRQELQRAGLSMPTFESDRDNDLFRVTFLFHHLLGESEWSWLGKYKEKNLTEYQMMALVYIRETGEISNSAFRDLTGLDTLQASASIRKLREIGLLEKRGGGQNTHYVASSSLMSDMVLEAAEKQQITLHDSLHDSLHDKGTGATQSIPVEAKLPVELRKRLVNLRLGRRAAPEEVSSLIIQVCAHGPFSKEQIASMIGREPPYVAQSYLSPMVRDGRLTLTIPGSPSHPDQKYRPGS